MILLKIWLLINRFVITGNVTDKNIVIDIISNSKDVLESESDKIKSDFLYVIKHSDLILAKLVQSKTGIKILPVTEKEYSLIDKGAVAEYFELLKEKEQKAILHLMENLTNTN